MAANLKNITIIIPAHNRPQHLTRVLDYYSKIDLRVIVVDSSKQIFKNRKLFKKIDYYYLRNSSNSSMADKIYLALTKVKTKYSVVCSEDDFVNPRGTVHCAKFLEKHSDYASAQGCFISFTNTPKGIIFKSSYRHSKNINLAQKLPCERIKTLLDNYMQLLYALHRTEILKDVFKVIVENKIKNFNLHELMMGILSVTAGKHKVLKVFYASREKIPREKNKSRLTSNPAYYLETWGVACSPEHKKDFFRAINAIARYLNLKKKTRLPFSQSRKFLLKCHRHYSNLQKSKLKKKLTFWDKITSWNYLENALRDVIIGQFIKSYYYYYRFIKKEEKGAAKRRAGIKRIFFFFNKKDFRDLVRIERYVRKYNITY